MKYAKRTQVYENFATTSEAASDGASKYGFNIVQPKHDGWWACVVVKRHAGVALIYSRQGALKKTLPVDGAMPPCVLLGEFIVGTQRAKADAMSEKVVAFDVLEYGGRYVGSKGYALRTHCLASGVNLCSFADWLEPVQSFRIADHARAWNREVEQNGAEGLIFRNKFHAYDEGAIGRVKKTFTMDYVVMDVLPGEGKHEGRMGAVVCGLYEGKRLVEKVRVGGGWSDQERDAIWSRPRSYIGRVLEVRGWQVFASGSMRHPNAIGFRDDKDASECVFTTKGGR